MNAIKVVNITVIGSNIIINPLKRDRFFDIKKRDNKTNSNKMYPVVEKVVKIERIKIMILTTFFL